MQVDLTGFVQRPHRSSRGRVQQCTPIGQPSTDQSRCKVGADRQCNRGEVAQQLFKIEIIMGPGWAKPKRPWLLDSILLCQEGSQAREAVHDQVKSVLTQQL